MLRVKMDVASQAVQQALNEASSVKALANTLNSPSNNSANPSNREYGAGTER